MYRPSISLFTTRVSSKKIGDSAIYDELAGGTPLTLAEILDSGLLRISGLGRTEMSSFSLSLPDSTFPLLSQGEHPTTGRVCWYLHPCGMPATVAEVMAEVTDPSWTEAQYLVRWMEAWFMVLSTVINL